MISGGSCIAALVTTALLATPAASPTPGGTPTSAAAQPLYRFADTRIDEASGIAVGIASPGIDYVQNDSGDLNRFFAVDARTGATVATVTMPGVRNVDWEDIAVARDAASVASVWLADIGDNGARRSEVEVYRVAEPRLAPTQRSRSIRAGAPAVWRLRYPSGAVDAESLAVAPDGTGYLVTKSFSGRSSVYRLPPAPDPDRVQSLQQVATIDLRAFAGRGLLAAPDLLATGAAISPDGQVFVLRTYAAAYLWRVRNGDLAAALRSRPVRLALPAQPQGEGVDFAGRRLIIDSEGVHSAVYAVPLPAGFAPPAAPPGSSAASRSAPSAPRASPPVGSATGSTGTPIAILVGGVLGAALLAGGGWWLHRRRHARRL